jgi:hypothetical protein
MFPNKSVTDVPACTLWFALCRRSQLAAAKIASLTSNDRSAHARAISMRFSSGPSTRFVWRRKRRQAKPDTVAENRPSLERLAAERILLLGAIVAERAAALSPPWRAAPDSAVAATARLTTALTTPTPSAGAPGSDSCLDGGDPRRACPAGRVPEPQHIMPSDHRGACASAPPQTQTRNFCLERPKRGPALWSL